MPEIDPVAFNKFLQAIEDKKIICPRCRKPMDLRTNSATGNYFLGCSGFPDCKYNAPFPLNVVCKPINQILKETKAEMADEILDKCHLCGTIGMIKTEDEKHGIFYRCSKADCRGAKKIL
jgi:ssDNA-binding Zn-finger/Zn-ribbon topoisomerase 1